MYITDSIIDYVHSVANQFSDLNADSIHPGYRDEVDAFRHAYMSAVLTTSLGPDLAKMVMTEYERQHPNTDPNLTPEERIRDSEADEFNNLVGRDVALEWMQNPNGRSLEEAIYDAVKSGRTINDPATNTRELVDPGYTWNKQIDQYRSIFTTASTTAQRRDPLILDLDNDGAETIGVESGAFFDHDGNGFAEQTGWVSPDDGLLVRDINNDGVINNGRELFGDNTFLKDGTLATDGLQALADLDDNGDNKIDSNDSAFSQLKVWKDTNSDGISQAGELKTLNDLGIKSLNTTYTVTNITDSTGNTQTHQATYEKTDGSIQLMGNFLVQREMEVAA